MEGLRQKICAVAPLWRASLSLVVILILITLFSLAFLSPGTESFYISIINLTFLGVLLAGNLTVLYACERTSEPKDLEHVEMKDAVDDG